MSEQKTYLKTGAEIYTAHKNTFKAKHNRDWYEQMADYYIDLAESLNNTSTTKEAIQAAQGVITDDVMKEVLLQINDKEIEVEAKELNLLDDVDIITPIKERYMGEFVKTPNFYTATLQGEDITLAIKHKVQKYIFSIFTAKLKVVIDELVKAEEAEQEQQAAQKQQAMEANPEAQVQEQQAPKPAGSTLATDAPSAYDRVMAGIDIKKEVSKIKEEFYSKEASKAKQIVDFFVKDARFEEQLYQLFYYYFATEKVYVKFAPVVGNLGISMIHPEDYLRIPANQSIMVEDDGAGVIRTARNIKDILDEFGEKMSKDDLDYLNSLMTSNTNGNTVSVGADSILDRYTNSSTMYTWIKQKLSGQEKIIFANDLNNVWQYEYYYTTKRKIGTLSFITPEGLPSTTTVGDSYKLNPEYGDIAIEWDWEDEVWVGYRFGGADGVGVYIPPEPVLVQRSETDTANTCKIPIVGMNGVLFDYGYKPIPLRMISHQALYIILTNKYRKELAKFHGFVNLIPESIISDSDEFSQESRLEYMYKDNMLIFNDAEVDVNTLQSLRTIGNTGQGDYIRAINEMRIGCKAEAWDLANMNSERFGNIDVRGGKGNTEESIRRVSTGSVLMFTMFDMFKERVYQAISDYGRIVYIDGISTQYMRNEEMIDIDISHQALISSDIGIHFTTNSLEREKVDADKLQAAKEEREERLAQNEQEAKKYIEDKKAASEEAKIKGSLEEVDLKGKYDLLVEDKKVYIKMLEIQHESDMAEAGYDSDGDGTPDNYKGSDLTPEMQYLE